MARVVDSTSIDFLARSAIVRSVKRARVRWLFFVLSLVACGSSDPLAALNVRADLIAAYGYAVPPGSKSVHCFGREPQHGEVDCRPDPSEPTYCNLTVFVAREHTLSSGEASRPCSDPRRFPYASLLPQALSKLTRLCTDDRFAPVDLPRVAARLVAACDHLAEIRDPRTFEACVVNDVTRLPKVTDYPIHEASLSTVRFDAGFLRPEHPKIGACHF